MQKYLGILILTLFTLSIHLGDQATRPLSVAHAELSGPVDKNKIGINTKNWWMWPQQFDEEKFAPYVREIQNSGVGYVRIFAHWASLRQDQDTWRQSVLERMDRMLAEIKDSGMEPVVVFFNPPSWASLSPDGDNRDNYLISDVDAWQTFVQAMVARYGYEAGGLQYVKYWEVLNEPDLEGRKYDAVDYSALLKDTYSVIKDQDSEAEVLLAGLTQVSWQEFLPALLNQGAGDVYDILSIHVYERPERAEYYVTKFQDLLSQHNLDQPIWITEVNWGRGGYLSDSLYDQCPEPDDDPQWLVFRDYFENFLAAGAEKVFWHQARCSVWGPGFIENGSELPNGTNLKVRSKSLAEFREATGADDCLSSDLNCDGNTNLLDILHWRKAQATGDTATQPTGILGYLQVLRGWFIQ